LFVSGDLSFVESFKHDAMSSKGKKSSTDRERLRGKWALEVDQFALGYLSVKPHGPLADTMSAQQRERKKRRKKDWLRREFHNDIMSSAF
jgi:hypothetical protein